MRRLVSSSIALVLLAASCGGEAQTDYSAENAAEFFAACTEPLEDTRLVTRICDCVFAEIQVEIPYSRFVELEEELIAATAAEAEVEGAEVEVPLPPDLAELVARCVSEEADL